MRRLTLLLSYNNRRGTTAGYFERAFRQDHEVIYGGPEPDSETGQGDDRDLAKAVSADQRRPDLFVYIDSPGRFFPRGIDRLEIPTAAYLIDVHVQTTFHLELAALFDHVFIAQKDYLGAFRNVNPNTHWLPLACDPVIHGAAPESPKTYDVGFVGHMVGHRKDLLDGLARRFKMNDYEQRVPPEKLAEVYSQCRIVVNLPVNGDLNMRVFEAMAAGSLLVTPEIDNGQSDVFKSGVHLVTYSDYDELVDLIEFYLKTDEARERIARDGQRLVLNSETYLHRTRELLRVVGTCSGRAPARDEPPATVASRYLRIYCRKGMAASAVAAARKLRPFHPKHLPLYLRLAKVLARRRASN